MLHPKKSKVEFDEERDARCTIGGRHSDISFTLSVEAYWDKIKFRLWAGTGISGLDPADDGPSVAHEPGGASTLLGVSKFRESRPAASATLRIAARISARSSGLASFRRSSIAALRRHFSSRISDMIAFCFSRNALCVSFPRSRRLYCSLDLVSMHVWDGI
jgi:hypothetical protein